MDLPTISPGEALLANMAGTDALEQTAPKGCLDLAERSQTKPRTPRLMVTLHKDNKGLITSADVLCNGWGCPLVAQCEVAKP